MASEENDFERVADAGDEIKRLKKILDDKEAERLALLADKDNAEKLNHLYERQLAEAGQNLERSKLYTSDFLAGMSHEIRTPMNAVLGISEILMHNDQLTGQQKKYISDIKAASESLLTVISDILDLSQLETGKVDLISIHFNFRMMLNNVCSRGQYLAKTHGVGYRNIFKGEMPMYLFADDARYRQVMQGILDNAIIFSRRGSVLVEAEVRDEKWLHMTVSGTGSGLSPEDRPFIFDAFRAMDSASSVGLQGTRAGLSIFKARLNLALCKRLATLMGGDITFEANDVNGCIFNLSLPLVPGDEEKMSPAGPRISHSGVKLIRILIVDDDEVNLNVAAGLLKSLFGLRSDLATSGRQALQKVQRNNYDLIFMDHMMPEMDGVETTARIRALGGKFKDMPIIALTANTIIGNRERLLASGLSDFLPKPLCAAELEKMLNTWAPGCVGLKNGPMEMQSDNEEQPVDLWEKLEALEVIDVALGLKTVAGNQELYVRSLRILHNKIPTLGQLLVDLLECDDLKEMGVHFHGLKSSLASVGGVGLTRLAFDLEKASMRGDLSYVRNYMPPFLQLLNNLGARLKVIFSGAGQESKPKLKGDSAFLKSGLKALRQALEQYDSEAVDRCMRQLLLNDFGTEADRVLAEVSDKIEAFEYEAGAEILKASFEDYDLG